MRGLIMLPRVPAERPTPACLQARSYADLTGPCRADATIGGVLEAIVDHDVAELVLRGELGLGHTQARGDLVLVVGAAADQTRAQRVERRRRDEDLHGLGQRGAHLAGALE